MLLRSEDNAPAIEHYEKALSMLKVFNQEEAKPNSESKTLLSELVTDLVKEY